MNLVRRLRARRHRARLAWLALLALLFQQVALAGYACPVVAAPAEPPRMSGTMGAMAGCEGMDMPDAHAPALCDQHCQRDHVTSPDLKVPQVPSLALPSVHFALDGAMPPPAQEREYVDVPVCRSDPPPAQRFCSLQI